MSLFFVVALACSGEEAAKAADVMLGTITAERAGESGMLEVQRAFTYQADGLAALFTTPHAEATCEDATAFLDNSSGGSGERAWEPNTVFVSGRCASFTVFQDYDAAGTTVDDDVLGAIIALNCSMDEGEWEYDEDEETYFYTGPYWQGSPKSVDRGATAPWSASLTGGSGAAATWTLEMHDYDGDWTYENLEEAPASGTVSGGGSAEWCSGFAELAQFEIAAL